MVPTNSFLCSWIDSTIHRLIERSIFDFVCVNGAGIELKLWVKLNGFNLKSMYRFLQKGQLLLYSQLHRRRRRRRLLSFVDIREAHEKEKQLYLQWRH